MALRAVLKQLESALKQKYPSKLAELEPPAARKELDSLEKKFGRPLPAEVRELYGWRGGGDGFLVLRGDDEESEGWDWSRPGNVAGDLAVWRKVHEDFPRFFLPLFSNGAGDDVCLDADSGALVGVFHEEPKDRPRIAKSLEEALSYVLKRVKAGTWRGSPESGQVKALLTKLSKPGADWFGIFGNSLFTLTQKDPAGSLTVLDGAQKIVEKARAAAPKDEQTMHVSRFAQIAATRTLALLTKRDGDAAWAEYGRWLALCRELGSLERPILIAAGFGKLRQKDREWQVAEVTAMDETYLLYKWLSARLESGARRKKSLADLVKDADELLAEVTKRDERARMLLMKGLALGGMGRAADAKKAWAAASKLNAKLTAFWKSHPLLAA